MKGKRRSTPTYSLKLLCFASRRFDTILVQPTEGFLTLPCVCFIVPLPPTTKLQKDHGAKVVCIEIKSVLLYFYFHGTTSSSVSCGEGTDVVLYPGGHHLRRRVSGRGASSEYPEPWTCSFFKAMNGESCQESWLV
jgi:hypothetical protein